ncbi:MAG TPA: aminodeoxychorismate/anthranilate synthase component II [Coxiellaceae bacterium]|nr:aminodeoxychorismate/anthranilate synthase component II [Coxiellaceae bacterium]
MILLIDNYDSFVYNLARYVVELGYEAEVHRNDAISIEEIAQKPISHLIISPGPCTPLEAGISLEAIRTFENKIPILGICLGHQAIAQAYGAQVIPAKRPLHGMNASIRHTGTHLFNQIKNPLIAGRYHSLIVDNIPPDVLEVTAWSEENEIMAIHHKKYPIFGLQFHPESILTEQGHALLNNFLTLINSKESLLV